MVKTDTDQIVDAGRIEKMSKSKRNVVDPELIISGYAATARLFMMSIRHPNAIWNGPIQGWRVHHVSSINFGACHLQKTALVLADLGTTMPETLDDAAKTLIGATHRTIASISEDIEQFRFNRCVAALYSYRTASPMPKVTAKPKIGHAVLRWKPLFN